jgi:D-amino-acid dehydrogenase
MHVLVIGAGLAGVTAAWELRESGHDVTVLDRGSEAATETSYANAGLVCPGHALPWASPEVPGMLLRSLFSDNQAYRLKPRLEWQMMRWGVRFLRQCTHGRMLENAAAKYRLCRYAQNCLHDVTEKAGLNYDSQRGGLLYLYGSEATLRKGVEEMKVVEDLGQEIRVLGIEEVVELDPAYSQSVGRIAGAVYCPTDESGDARVFCLQLAEACRERGAAFQLDCTVERIVAEGKRVVSLVTSNGDVSADAYVLASGVEAPWLARRIGLDLPIYPVKGYSATFPVESVHRSPVVGGVDEDHLIAFSRLGDRLRVTSTAEIAGYDTSYRPEDFGYTVESFATLMPAAADFSRPEYWSCLRPMTPTGLPVVGPCRYGNLYLNVGHGHLGWTMACGTARLVADIIDGRQTEIPMQGMALH